MKYRSDTYFIYILSLDIGESQYTTTYKVYDTYYMNFSQISLIELLALYNANIHFKNLNIQNSLFKPKRDTSKINEILLYKYNNNYLTVDKNGHIHIRSKKYLYDNNKIIGNLNTASGKISAYDSKLAEAPNRIKKIYSMIEFNYKSKALGVPTYKFTIDSLDNISLISIKQTETTDIVIPDVVDRIIDNAFINSNITSVKIGKKVRYIGAKAFSNCNRLHTVILGDNVKKIDNFAFYSCTKLNKLYINKNLKSIGEFAFYNTGLTEFIGNNKLSNIDEHAFEKCIHLKIIDLKDTEIVKINSNIFKSCIPIKLHYPIKLKSLNFDGFPLINKLTDLYIPNSIDIITGGSFSEQISLRKQINKDVKTNKIEYIDASKYLHIYNLR